MVKLIIFILVGFMNTNFGAQLNNGLNLRSNRYYTKSEMMDDGSEQQPPVGLTTLSHDVSPIKVPSSINCEPSNCLTGVVLQPFLPNTNFMKSGSTINVPADKNVLDDCIEINKVLSASKMKIKKSTLVDIFGKRLLDQRLLIVELYERVYRRNLIEKFEKKLCGKFGFIILGLITENVTFNAQLLYKFIKAKNIESIIFMICGKSSVDIKRIKEQYDKMYFRDCIGDIMNIVKDGRLKHLLSLILLENRNENFQYIEYEEFFKESCEKGKDSIFVTDSPDVFNRLFATSNPSFLNLLFKYYEQSTSWPIERRLRDLFRGGSYLLALIITYKFIWNSDTCYCEIINTLCNTKNHIGIIAFIIEHSEMDLSRIIELHNMKYSIKFKDRLKGLFEGNSLEILLQLSNNGIPVQETTILR